MTHSDHQLIARLWGARSSVLVASVGLAMHLAGPARAQEAPAAGPLAGSLADASAANINLTPRRVIFTENKRTEVVYVFNQGNKAATVDVALVDNVMLPGGEIIPVEQANERGGEAAAAARRLSSGKDMILATPRRLTLEPGKGKAIRLRAALPETLADPMEYRAHLTVTTLPDAESGVTAEALANASRGELAMRVKSLFGISIPLIVRTGQHNAALTADAFSITQSANAPDQYTFSFRLSRSGTSSVYGNVEVWSRTGKNDEVIGFIRGIGVYPEIDSRIVRVKLTRKPQSGELLSISFKTDEGVPGGPQIAASYRVP